MVANSRKKQSPGTHRSLKAEFISMEAPFKVVLNWILSPNTEFRARQKACAGREEDQQSASAAALVCATQQLHDYQSWYWLCMHGRQRLAKTSRCCRFCGKDRSMIISTSQQIRKCGDHSYRPHDRDRG